MGSCTCNYWVFKVLLVGFCLLLLFGLLMQSRSGIGSKSSSSSSSRRAVLMGRTSLRRHEEVLMGNEEEQKQKRKRKELVYNPELDLNYMMSKRRVPNGPDPIHNRNRPPGRA